VGFLGGTREVREEAEALSILSSFMIIIMNRSASL
jgi:hypothetical protein